MMAGQSTVKNERINLRVSHASLQTVRDAAALQGQDLTSFVMGAALDRARNVLAEDLLLRLTPREVAQLEESLDSEPRVMTQLAAMLTRYGDDAASHDR
jgi:uncharacterized protein (DUF1778 family)